MKRVPNVTVEYTTVPSGEIQEKTLVTWSSDTGPDVVFDSSRMLMCFMDLDPFLDVTKDFAQHKFKPADFYETSLRFY
jgi:ABC-type glycerol-3-phosphate transport system substrate-binding protein